jgi:hypothetical protein
LTNALQAFESRTDLKQFAPNGLVLFALELRFGIDDIATAAATALTDGGQDRKCDLVYIDEDSRTAVLVQGYLAANAASRLRRPTKRRTSPSRLPGSSATSDLSISERASGRRPRISTRR